MDQLFISTPPFFFLLLKFKSSAIWHFKLHNRPTLRCRFLCQKVIISGLKDCFQTLSLSVSLPPPTFAHSLSLAHFISQSHSSYFSLSLSHSPIFSLRLTNPISHSLFPTHPFSLSVSLILFLNLSTPLTHFLSPSHSPYFSLSFSRSPIFSLRLTHHFLTLSFPLTRFLSPSH